MISIQEQYPQYFTKTGAIEIPTIKGPQIIQSKSGIREFPISEQNFLGIPKKYWFYFIAGLLTIRLLKRR